jgi:hypothetical protein
MNIYRLTVGDKITDGANIFTVSRVAPPGTHGTRVSDGPHVTAHIRPGGYSVDIDARNAQRYKLLP